MNKNQLLNIAGGFWVFIGLFLIYRSAGLYQLALSEQQSTDLAIAISVITGMIIGGIKGKFVLIKTARKNRSRIDDLDGPLKMHQVFAAKFYLLIPAMILLGVLLRTFNEYLGGYVVVAAVYFGIGMALMVSSIPYWKASPEPLTEKNS